jgi:hypothetical protein
MTQIKKMYHELLDESHFVSETYFTILPASYTSLTTTLCLPTRRKLTQGKKKKKFMKKGRQYARPKPITVQQYQLLQNNKY